jgi:hypothetical protein
MLAHHRRAIRHAVLGNAGTLISFRMGPNDASILAREFQPKIEVVDLLNLPNHAIYLRLMIDGAPSRPFSAQTTAPKELSNTNCSWHSGYGDAVHRGYRNQRR